MAFVLAACGSPIVGAECRPGFVSCDGQCVDPKNDPANCGRCGHDCGAHECKANMCGPGPRPDAGLDGGVLGDAGADASVGAGGTGGSGLKPPGVTKGGTGSPFTPDGGLMFPDDAAVGGCGLGQTRCAGKCVDLLADTRHCGACGHACGSEQFCIAGECEDLCEAPLRLCGAQCVDFQSDERNCGACGKICASGICDDGACADALPGSLVVIGHDYSAASSSVSPAMKRLAANAVFLASGTALRTLVYRGKAKAASCDGVLGAVRYVFDKIPLAFAPDTVAADDVTKRLRDADVFMICAQAGATDEELETLGQSWGLAMAQFLYRGGVVALFETTSSSNTGTYHLLEPAGLFAAASREGVTPAKQKLTVQDPRGIANQVQNPYRSSPTTVHFVDVQTDGIAVVTDNADLPVVIHRVIAP